jgi:hypothetical protein
MLKIAVQRQSRQSATLYLEGVVTGPWVEELEASCSTALASGAFVTLDLSGVSFLSREAVRLIRTLMGQAVAVRNCSSFVGAQLDIPNGGPGA